MNVKPFRDDNAVKIAAFVFAFTDKIGHEALMLLRSAHEAGKLSRFTKVQVASAVTVKVGPGAPSSFEEDDLAGVSFEGYQDDGQLALVLQVRDNLMYVQIVNYSSWDEDFNLLQEIFDECFSIVGALPNLQSISIEYLDEFDVIDPSKDWVGELFSKSSPLTPDFIFETNGFWHSHNGFIRDGVLTKLNLEHVTGEDGTHKALLLNQVRLMDASDFSLNDDKASCYAEFDALHGLHIECVKSILTDKMCEIVGLI